MSRSEKVVHLQRLSTLLLIGAFLAILFGIPGVIHAQATITVVNLDSPGEGFNDSSPPDADSTAGGNSGATLGEQRLIAFQYAADIWGSLLDSSVEILVGANFDPLSCDATSATLGGAGTNTVHRDFAGAPVANTWYPAALANSLAETDLAPTFDDIGATFNSAIGTTCPFPNVWYYGLDGNTPAGTIDFVTVVLHELGHGLGFQTFVNLITGAKFNNFDDTFMLNLEDHSTGKLYSEMNDGERLAASTATDDLHWAGCNVIAESGGLTAGRDPTDGHVEMYAPNPQEPGSSVSHFSTSLSPDELMEPFFTGTNQDVGLAEALMEDIGWVRVNPIDNAPTSTSATITTDEDTASSGVTPSVTDCDSGDTHTFSIISQPTNGTASVASNQLFYTPNADFNGTDSFTFRATDTGGLWVEGTASVTVNPINDAPVGQDDSYSVVEDTTLTVALPGVLSNDTDIDGDTLTAVLVTDVTSGSLTLNSDGSFVYTPNANFSGTVIFTYQANDTLADSNVATVAITVGAVNDAPVAQDDSYSIAEDTTLTVALPGVLSNDTDIEGDTLSAVLVDKVSDGTLTLNSDGSFVYTPNANFFGTDIFTYQANDTLADSNVATVTITVSRDVDGDGISDQEEYGPDGTDVQYDGNNDNIPDSQQDKVASFLTDDRNSYVTLAVPSPVGATLSSVRAVSPPGGAPSGINFPHGFFEFTVNGAPTPPAETIVRLFLPDAATTTYYKYGQTAVSPTDHWYEFLYDGETGAEINGNVITLYFVDGSRGDDILLQDGMIIDQGGPGVASSGGGGGGGCFIATTAFGSPLKGQVEIMRQFRNKYLVPTILGRAFVASY